MHQCGCQYYAHANHKQRPCAAEVTLGWEKISNPGSDPLPEPMGHRISATWEALHASSTRDAPEKQGSHATDIARHMNGAEV